MQPAISLHELLQPYQLSHNLRPSSKNLLVKHRFNVNSYGKRALSVVAPDLWKPLPQDIKSSCTGDILKCKLKTLPFTRDLN